MCQVLGISYAKPSHFNKVWDKFRMRADKNPDGWGIAYGGSQGLTVVKEPHRADWSPMAAALGMAPLPALMMIGHIRRATRGGFSLVNTHPFFAQVGGRDWAMVHNGSLSGYGYTPGQQGQTDSEAFFLRLVDQLAITGQGHPYDVAEVVAEEIHDAGRHGKLNILLTDGESLFVHTNLPGSLYQLQTRAGIMFCSKPLTRQRGWKLVETNRVFIYQTGGFVYRTSVINSANSEDTDFQWVTHF